MENRDVFIAYHGTYDQYGSLGRAQELFNYLESKGVKCYFFPEEKSTYFAETPIAVKHAKKFLLVCNNYIKLNEDGTIVNNGINQELHTFWNCIYEGKRQRGDARVYSFDGFTAEMANELHIAFQGVAHFDESNFSTEKCFESIYSWVANNATDDSSNNADKVLPPVTENLFSLNLMKKFRTISNIFTLLDIDYLPSQSSADFFDLNDLVQRFQEEKEEKFLLASSIILKKTTCIIYGEGGSGKTTFLQHKAYEVASESIENSHVVPLYIRLSECDERTFESFDNIWAVAKNSFDEISLNNQGNDIQDKKLILFLDGLDEYSIDNSEKTLRMFEKIKSFSLLNNCSIVITCRTEYLPKDISFQKYKISPLSDSLVKEFIQKYFDFFNIELDSDSFLLLLPHEVLSLTKSPLILSMVIAQYYTTKSIPSGRDELYEKIMIQLLKKKPIISEMLLPVSEKFYVLCYLAFSILLSGRLSCDFNDAVKIIEERNTYNLSSEKILEDFIHSGIVNRNEKYISFFHSSILEFFSTQEINKEYSFVAKATMDQYFLRNAKKINRIIRCIRSSDSDTIVEVGAGIGTVSLQLTKYKRLFLIDLDEGLCKILNYNFRNKDNCEIIQGDAIKMLKTLKYDKVISNLPFFLTKDVLRALETADFQLAVLSIKEDDNLSEFAGVFDIEELGVLTEDDFFPRQPFQSRLIKVTKASNT